MVLIFRNDWERRLRLSRKRRHPVPGAACRSHLGALLSRSRAHHGFQQGSNCSDPLGQTGDVIKRRAGAVAQSAGAAQMLAAIIDSFDNAVGNATRFRDDIQHFAFRRDKR